MKYFECKGRRYYCIGQPLLRFFLLLSSSLRRERGKSVLREVWIVRYVLYDTPKKGVMHL